MTADIVLPAVILIRPQMGENIGAAARAMWNFGLDRMRIVAPRDGWPNQTAVALASGAGRVLDEAQLHDDLPSALSDLTHVYATTARPRELTKPVMTPEAAMADAARRIRSGERVGLMFGPERAGMENADIARASTIVTIPVNPEFPSLNLAQAVLLLAYEWRRATEAAEPVRLMGQRTELAEGRELSALGDHYEATLEGAGFFYPPEKAENMKLNLRNLWSRMPLTRADVQMLHGMLRQIMRRRDQD